MFKIGKNSFEKAPITRFSGKPPMVLYKSVLKFYSKR